MYSLLPLWVASLVTETHWCEYFTQFTTGDGVDLLTRPLTTMLHDQCLHSVMEMTVISLLWFDSTTQHAWTSWNAVWNGDTRQVSMVHATVTDTQLMISDIDELYYELSSGFGLWYSAYRIRSSCCWHKVNTTIVNNLLQLISCSQILSAETFGVNPLTPTVAI